MMQDEKKDCENITAQRFFSLSSVSGLIDFCTLSVEDDDFTIILKQRASHWLAVMQPPAEAEFNPAAFLSQDLSAIYYGRAPVIFLGSNKWAIKAAQDYAFLEEKLRHFEVQASVLASRVNAKLCFTVVPEKDFVIDRIAGRDDKIRAMRTAMRLFGSQCKSLGHGFVFDEFIDTLPDWVSHDEYNYPDSHLLSRDYFLIFKNILKELGINTPGLISGTGLLEFGAHYGDLNQKFDTPIDDKHQAIVPKRSFSQALLTDGCETFQSPLGATWQRFRNDAAPIDAKIAIYGDSHSSIFPERRLTFLSSALFKNCDFYWNPWGGNPNDFTTDADFVLMEISQRFLFT